MRFVQSIAEQLREVRELWCKFTGKCEIEPLPDDRIDWLRDQQIKSEHATRDFSKAYDVPPVWRHQRKGGD